MAEITLESATLGTVGWGAGVAPPAAELATLAGVVGAFAWPVGGKPVAWAIIRPLGAPIEMGALVAAELLIGRTAFALLLAPPVGELTMLEPVDVVVVVVAVGGCLRLDAAEPCCCLGQNVVAAADWPWRQFGSRLP